jgi:peptidoglycan/LPS O-acetylase OafA/YrhL
MTPPVGRMPQLDGVRGLAILLVVCWHYLLGGVPPQGGVRQALTLSWAGVDLFFVLSGFLIGGILLDRGTSGEALRIFFVRRFFRIIPLYVIVLLAGFVLGASGFAPIIWYATFTQNVWMAVHNIWGNYFCVTWSLAVEEYFYLILPLALVFLPRKWLPFTLLGVIVIAIPCRIAAATQMNTIASKVLFPCRMDALAVGVLCAWAIRQRAILAWIEKDKSALYLAFALLSVWPALATLEGWSQGSIPMETFGYTPLALGCGCLIGICVVDANGTLARIFRFVPLRRLGTLSYCIYLIHGGVFDIVSNLVRLGPFVLSAASFFVTTLVAELSWRFFEAPLLSVSHKPVFQARSA